MANVAKQIAVSIGGSGARTAEALLYLCAAGLGPDTMTLVFVDADTSNGSLKKVVELARLYQSLQSAQPDSCPLFKTRIELANPPTWSPFPGGHGQPKLASFFDYSGLLAQQSTRGTGRLMEALFTEDHRTAPLDDGFLGKPSIGAAVLSRAINESVQPWTDVVDGMKTRVGNGEQVSVFCMGSIFGGTGAAGLPTIPKLLLDSVGQGKSNVCLGAALLLPYFSFPVPAAVNETGRVFASPDTFLLNSKEALRHYHSLGDLFNRIYLVGTTKLAPQQKFRKGGEEQNNLPHFVELVAASGAIDFFRNAQPANRTIHLAKVESETAFHWSDHPEQERDRPALSDLSTLCYFFLAKVMPRLRDIRAGVSGATRTPWYQHLIVRRGLNVTAESEWSFFEAIDLFSKRFLVWLRDLQANHGGVDVGLAETTSVSGIVSSREPAVLNESLFRGGLIINGRKRSLREAWARLCEQENFSKGSLDNHREFQSALYAAAGGK
jgi:hypothetical protein